jgi:hypothetical protein
MTHALEQFHFKIALEHFYGGYEMGMFAGCRLILAAPQHNGKAPWGCIRTAGC